LLRHDIALLCWKCHVLCLVNGICFKFMWSTLFCNVFYAFEIPSFRECSAHYL